MQEIIITPSLSKKVVDLRTKILGEEHQSSINDMINLAISYRKIGKFEEALSLSKKVVDIRTKILGEDHPATVGALSNLASSYRKTRHNQEALMLAKGVVDWRKEKDFKKLMILTWMKRIQKI